MFSLSLRLARRQLLSGQLLPVALAAALITAVTAAMAGVVQRLQAGVLEQASEVLAADYAMQGGDAGVLQVGADLPSRIPGLRVAEAAEANSMMFSASSRQLVSVKAVGPAYPLLGRVEIADAPFGPPTPVAHGPPPGEAWLESRLFSRLGIALGDSVELGDATLRATMVLVREPDRIAGLGGLTPRVMATLQDARRAGILAEGARARFKRMFVAPRQHIPQLGELLEPQAGELYSLLSAHANRLSPEGDAARGVSPASGVQRTLDNTRATLLLATLVALLLALTAASLAARRYLETSLGQFAMLRATGVEPAVLGRLFAGVQLFGVAPGMALGIGLAYLAQTWMVDLLATGFGVQLPPGDAQPLAFGALVALLGLCAAFGPSLFALLRLTPMALWQDSGAAMHPVLQWGPLAALLAALALAYSQSLELTASVAGGIAAAAALAWLVARAVLALAARLARVATGLLRSGLANLVMHRAGLALQVTALALVLLPVLAVSGLRSLLSDDWHKAFPQDTPNHILANMTEADVQAVDAWLAGQGSGLVRPAKMMRVQLRVPAKNPGRDDFTRGVNISTSQQLPEGNRLVAGAWWSGAGPEVSLEDEFAQEVGAALGDELVFQRDGHEFRARVASLREVDWGRMTPNFWVLVSPGMARELPATWLGSFRLEERGKSALNELVRLFPTVHLYEFDRLVAEAQAVFQRLSGLLAVVVGMTFAASALVLGEVVGVQLQSRRTEWALLRATGVSAARVWVIAALEFLFSGALAGLAAALGAEVLLYFMVEQVGDLLRYVRQPQLWWWGAVGGGLGVLVSVGWMAIPHLRARPMAVLRAEDS